MLHITKTKSGKFQVVLIGKNNEVLSSSEELNTRQSARKNVFAQLDEMEESYFQDDTKKDPVVESYRLGEELEIFELDGSPLRATIYIPGKNPVKKSVTKKSK